MVAWILKKILGSKNQRELKRLMPIVRQVNEFDEQFKSLSDDELRAKTAAWKEEISKLLDIQEQWKKLDEVLPEAFAVVKNAARRLKDRGQSFTVCDQPMVWDMVHFDVQLLGGIVLHKGRIAEMATGEGKTLVATLPLYLNALTGRGAHLVTVNDYLARRDAEWMGQLYNFLGLTIGCIQHDQEPDVRPFSSTKRARRSSSAGPQRFPPINMTNGNRSLSNWCESRTCFATGLPAKRWRNSSRAM